MGISKGKGYTAKGYWVHDSNKDMLGTVKQGRTSKKQQESLAWLPWFTRKSEKRGSWR